MGYSTRNVHNQANIWRGYFCNHTQLLPLWEKKTLLCFLSVIQSLNLLFFTSHTTQPVPTNLTLPIHHSYKTTTGEQLQECGNTHTLIGSKLRFYLTVALAL